VVVLVGILVVGSLTAWALPREPEAGYGLRQNVGQGMGPAEQAPGGYLGDPVGLSESEAEALLMALDGEYKAWSVYEQVILDFGTAWPFPNIQKAEENHIAALVRLFDYYGLEVPENPWPGQVPTFESVAEACAAGAEVEIDNAALYDQLFSMVDNPDIIRVFTSLQQASETKHLPAFEQCVEQAPAGAAQSFLPVLAQ
jgi:hypothetical protein